MGLGCTGFIAKLLLFVINFAVFACGAVLLAVGIVLAKDDEGIAWISDITGDSDMNDGLFKAAVYLMIAIGVVLFIVGFLGCCGACKENTCMLNMYACLVSVFLVVQIAAGILAAVFAAEIDETFELAMETSARDKYGGELSEVLDKAWDSMQIEWECCGGSGYEDYFNNTNIQNLTVPVSCCTEAKMKGGNVTIAPEENFKCQNASFYGDTASVHFNDNGCYDEFKTWVDENTKIIMGVFFGLAALQLIGVVFACCVKGKISSNNKVG